MSVEAQRQLCELLKANLDAARRALAANDMTALMALAEQEARYMDSLSACWSVDGPAVRQQGRAVDGPHR